MKPIGVMVVDDSATVRQLLTSVLQEAPDIEVIATAVDPLFAMLKMQRRWPDVIVLDVEMPRMDGLTFLRQLMNQRPTPVVVCSSLTTCGAEITMQALTAGAISVIAKPQIGLREFLLDSGAEITAAVRAAAAARPRRMSAPPSPSMGSDAIPVAELSAIAMARTTEKIVAVGASTGGTQAIEQVLTRLPRVCPGVVIVQHMPEAFTGAFAARLDRLCAITVREACCGDRVLPGLALIAPGGRHMLLKRSGPKYYVDVVDGPPVNRHRPSVDVLFRSVARCAGRNALAVIMTGMGDDGARGIREVRDAGGSTVAQDEATCVVYGMPKEAVRAGGVERSLPLEAVADAVVRHGA